MISVKTNKLKIRIEQLGVFNKYMLVCSKYSIFKKLNKMMLK